MRVFCATQEFACTHHQPVLKIYILITDHSYASFEQSYLLCMMGLYANMPKLNSVNDLTFKSCVPFHLKMLVKTCLLMRLWHRPLTRWNKIIQGNSAKPISDD